MTIVSVSQSRRRRQARTPAKTSKNGARGKLVDSILFLHLSTTRASPREAYVLLTADEFLTDPIYAGQARGGAPGRQGVIRGGMLQEPWCRYRGPRAWGAIFSSPLSLQARGRGGLRRRRPSSSSLCHYTRGARRTRHMPQSFREALAVGGGAIGGNSEQRPRAHSPLPAIP